MHRRRISEMAITIKRSEDYFKEIHESPSFSRFIDISQGLRKRCEEIKAKKECFAENAVGASNNLLTFKLHDHMKDIVDYTDIIEQNKQDVLLFNDSLPIVPKTPLFVDRDEFRLNFDLFTNDLFKDMDMSNLFILGGAINACLLPVPEKNKETVLKRRNYFHNQKFKGSDIDLYIYGLNEEEAKKKLISICHYFEDKIPMCEIKYIRTCYTVTIVTRFPYRHIQIVNKLYKNINEILLGVDVDCSCVGYDGKDVYTSCKGFHSLISRCNVFNFNNPSASIRGRYIKYSQRGFSVYVPGVDKAKLNPQIYTLPSSEIGEIAKLFSYDKIGGDDVKDQFVNDYHPYKARDRNNRQRGRRRRQIRETLGIKASDYAAMYLPWDIKVSVSEIVNTMTRKDKLLNSEEDVKSRGYHYHPCFMSDTIEDLLPNHCPQCPEVPKDVVDKELEYMVRGEFKWVISDSENMTNSFHQCSEEDLWKNLYTDEERIEFIENVHKGNIDKCKEIVTKVNENKDKKEKEENDKEVLPFATDQVNRNLLFDAVLTNDIGMIDYLLSSGLRLDVVNEEGFSLIHYCVIHQNKQMLEHILNINKRRTENIIKDAKYQTIVKNLDKLLNKEKWMFDDIEKPDIISINKMDKQNGNTAFHYAIKLGNKEICEVLRECKCNVFVGCNYGRNSPYLLCDYLLQNEEDNSDKYKIMTKYLHDDVKIPTVYFKLKYSLFDYSNQYLEYILNEFEDVRKSINDVQFGYSTLLSRACNGNDNERIKILLKYHPKIYYTTEEIIEYTYEKDKNKDNYRTNNDLNILENIFNLNDIEVVELIFKEYSEEISKLKGKCVFHKQVYYDDNVIFPDGISDTLKENLLFDSNKDYYEKRDKVAEYFKSQGFNIKNDDPPRELPVIIGRSKNINIEKQHYNLWELFKAIENDDINTIKNITSNINDPKYVMISTTIKNILNPVQYAVFLQKFDLVIPLLEIAMKQYHPIKIESKTPLTIKNSSINGDNYSPECGSYYSDCSDNMEEDNDEDEDLSTIMIDAASEANPIELVNSYSLITKYLMNNYHYKEYSNHISIFKVLLTEKKIDIAEKIYNMMKESKLLDYSFIDLYCKTLVDNQYYTEFKFHFDDFCEYCITEKSDIYAITNFIETDIELIEWFFNPENRISDKIIKTLKSKKYITVKEEEDAKEGLSISNRYLISYLRKMINENKYSCLSTCIDLFKQKYNLELKKEEKIGLFFNGVGNVKEEGELNIIISLFMKDFNNFISTTYILNNYYEEKDENNKKRNEVLLKYLVSNFKDKYDELTIHSLMEVLRLPFKILEQLLPYFKWDKIVSYFNNEKNSSIYHYLDWNVCMETFDEITKQTLKIDDNGYNVEDYRGLTGYDDALYKILLRNMNGKVINKFIHLFDCNKKKRVFVTSERIVNGINSLKSENKEEQDDEEEE